MGKKGGKTLNPAMALAKKNKEREKKRNKELRKAKRETLAMLKDPTRITEEPVLMHCLLLAAGSAPASALGNLWQAAGILW